MADAQLLLQLWKDPEYPVDPALPPGEYIRRLLVKKNWSQADLATVVQRPLPTINEIVNGKRAITPEMAIALGKAFQTAPDLWIHREAAYRLSLVKNAPDDDTAQKARLFEQAPIKDMQRRGWISSKASTASELERELDTFLNVDILASARRSEKTIEFSNSQRAWLCRAAMLAAGIPARPFSRDNLIAAMPKLRKLAAKPEYAAKVPIVLAEYGVRLLILEDLPRTKIDGAAFFLENNSLRPVVVMSIRIDRMDSAWHTLGHELQHVLRNDPLSLDSDIVGGERIIQHESMERAADEAAANWLIPKEEMDSFVLRTKPHFSRERINQFANRIGIHPSIIVGQLHHREGTWDKHNDMCPKIRSHFISVATTDGYLK